MSRKKSNRAETLKKRYQVYRRLGYDSYTARALSFRSLDVSKLEISKKTGKLKRNSVTKQYIEKDMIEWKRKEVIDRYNKRVAQPVYQDRKNIKEIAVTDTVFTPHGMLTHDKRYRGENGKIVSIIRRENKLTSDQAYYFFYIMTSNNMTYQETKKQLLSNHEFEVYVSKSRRRKR